MDIIILQDILDHASPEMTLAYAKLLDTTKKELFQEVLKSGVFSFKNSTELTEEELGDINDIALERFWMAYKLNAIDTPYGVCMQRSQGKCTYAIQPPCLTCRGGEPCKDLCIGVSNTDVEKYKVLLSSTKSMIDIGKINGREDMIKENQELYNRYSIIYDSIKKGNIIYGRANRIVTELRKEQTYEEK